jgi:hypothetical protein
LTTVASIATGIVKGVKMVIESGAKETVTIVKKEVTKVGNVAAKTATTVVDVLKQVGGISQAGAEAAASALEASLKYFRGTGKGTTEAEALKLVHCISLNRGGQVCAQSLASNAATAWFAADWSKLLPWLYVGGTAGTLGGVGYYVYSSSEKIGQTIGDAVQSVSAGIQAAAIAGLGVSVLLTMSTPAKTPKQRSERNYTVSSQFGLLVGAGVAVAVLASRKRQREEEEEK